MQKIILDCDPGMDDALAIINSISDSSFNLLGITTVAGNVQLKYTNQNALNILNYIGSDIPVFKGSHKPIKKELEVATEFHGLEGMGDLILDTSSKESLDGVAEFYLECAKKYPKEISLIAVGPLTNVALALKKYPELNDLLKEVIFMGGSLIGGNVTPYAEFNIFVDPEAANIVLSNPVPTTMIGLDATLKAQFSKECLDHLKVHTSHMAKFHMDIFESMFRTREAINKKTAAFHDSIAVLASVYKDAFVFKDMKIKVAEEGERRGETSEDKKGYPTRVAIYFDKNWFKDYLFEILK